MSRCAKTRGLREWQREVLHCRRHAVADASSSAWLRCCEQRLAALHPTSPLQRDALPANRLPAQAPLHIGKPPPCPWPLLQGVREGSQLLAQAFEQDPENPFVLLLLAHFCLRQGYADKVRRDGRWLVQSVQLTPCMLTAQCNMCCWCYGG